MKMSNAENQPVRQQERMTDDEGIKQILEENGKEAK